MTGHADTPPSALRAATSPCRGGIADALAAALARHVPGAAVENLARLSGGATQQSWSFDARLADGTVRPLVLRLAAAFQERDLGDEAKLVAAMRAKGIPVPEVAFALDPADGLGSGYAMARIAGEALPQRLLKDERFAPARSGFARQCGGILERIHAIDPAPFVWLERTTAASELAALEAAYRETGYARPVFEAALVWLAKRTPRDPEMPVPLHGDFRLGNLMLDERGITAVLDWELARVGDPLADLSWISVPSWRFGRLDLPVGGIGTRDDLLSGYGRDVDRDALRWWEMLGTLRWGVMCAGMTRWVRDGSDASVERVVIARRASEAELDLVLMMQGRLD